MTAARDSTLDRAGRTAGGWFGPAQRPLMGWLTRAPGGESRRGALILPPLGYEYMTTHRTLRTVAEQVAAAGSTALRIDYDGTGDSGGDQWDDDRVAAWRRSVSLGVEELRRLGCDHVTLVGLRFGATLALLEGAAANVQRVVAWAPVVSGRRYLREIRMLGLAPETAPERPELEGALSLGGFVFRAATLQEIGAVDLEQLAAAPAPAVLVIERPDGSKLTALADKLAGLGSEVDVRAIDGTQHCLDEPTEFATVPAEIVQAIAGWVNEPSDRPLPPADSPTHEAAADRVELRFEGAAITESVRHLGPRALVGIVGEPAGDAPAAPATIVFANSGSEPHIGPGRAWVEYSRELNGAGFRTIRLDCRGWGESPDDGFAPARPYDEHMATDLRETVEAIGAQGWGPTVLVGQCASAWMALEIARHATLDAVIACNPQLYWQPGDPKDVNMAVTRERREPERERIKRLGRWGWWSLLDAIGGRDPAARCLHDVNEHRTPTLLLFGHDDDGLEYLHDRARRALKRELAAGRIQVTELPGIDHGMHRAWLRAEVSTALLDFVRALAPSTRSVSR